MTPSTAPPSAPAALNFDSFMARVRPCLDGVKLAKATAMLRAERFHLFSKVDDSALVGIVRSQSSATRVYSCRLAADGTYSCCTQNLRWCGSLRGSLCKHLLVLIVGLAKAGDIDLDRLARWVESSERNQPSLDKEVMSATFLRYQGAQAGEVDWRPTETIPEDFYAL